MVSDRQKYGVQVNGNKETKIMSPLFIGVLIRSPSRRSLRSSSPISSALSPPDTHTGPYPPHLVTLPYSCSGCAPLCARAASLQRYGHMQRREVGPYTHSTIHVQRYIHFQFKRTPNHIHLHPLLPYPCSGCLPPCPRATLQLRYAHIQRHKKGPCTHPTKSKVIKLGK